MNVFGLKSWGILKEQATYKARRECDCGFSYQEVMEMLLIIHDNKLLANLIVGFEYAFDPNGTGYPCVFECPKCFEYTWFHIGEAYADIMKKAGDKWPK